MTAYANLVIIFDTEQQNYYVVFRERLFWLADDWVLEDKTRWRVKLDFRTRTFDIIKRKKQ